ncbi:MAG: YHS domain-containing protein [Candidatus Omnitrophota bacterium]
MPKDPVCGMSVLETSPFHLERKGKRHFFCSLRCLKSFSERASGKEEPPLPKRSFISVSLFGILLFVSFLFPALHELFHALVRYLRVVWWAAALGIFLGGCIDYYVPKEHISYFLAGESRKTILRATFLGFLFNLVF